jgi:cytidine deaminase
MLNRLDEAIQIAQEIEDDGRHFRIAAVGIRNDGAIIKSTNLPTKHPNPRVHAESRLMLKAGWGSTVFVARVLRNGLPALSKPCINCERIMRARGVKKVHYTINEHEYGTIVIRR